MQNHWHKQAAALLTALLTAVTAAIPAAAADIPLTGDGSGLILPIMGGLLGVSLVLLIIYFVISAKKKRK